MDTKDGRSGTPEPPRPISARVTRAPSSLGPEAATPLSQWDRQVTAPPVTHTEHSGPDGPPAVLTRRPHAAGGTPGSGGAFRCHAPRRSGPPAEFRLRAPFPGPRVGIPLPAGHHPRMSSKHPHHRPHPTWLWVGFLFTLPNTQRPRTRVSWLAGLCRSEAEGAGRGTPGGGGLSLAGSGNRLQ